jgi:hypothetical protein
MGATSLLLHSIRVPYPSLSSFPMSWAVFWLGAPAVHGNGLFMSKFANLLVNEDTLDSMTPPMRTQQRLWVYPEERYD